MAVIDVAPLLLDLPLPLVLLVPHAAEHVRPDPQGLGHAGGTLNGPGRLFLLVGVLLVRGLGAPLIEQWIQTQEEEHVDHKKRDDPED